MEPPTTWKDALEVTRTQTLYGKRKALEKEILDKAKKAGVDVPEDESPFHSSSDDYDE